MVREVFKSVTTVSTYDCPPEERKINPQPKMEYLDDGARHFKSDRWCKIFF